MERIAVRSRDIAVVGYDPDQSRLEVAFRSGGVYQYNGVPVEIHRELMESDSIGTYFNNRIKTAFPYTKVH